MSFSVKQQHKTVYPQMASQAAVLKAESSSRHALRLVFWLLFFSLAFITCFTRALQAEAPFNPFGDVAPSEPDVEVVLRSDAPHVEVGEGFHLYLDFKLKPKWHIYWRNAGETGYPVKVDWDVPEGLELGDIQWPVPERIEAAGLVSFGYHDRVVLVVPARWSDPSVAKARFEIGAKVSWLQCKQICMPASQSLKMTHGDWNPDNTVEVAESRELMSVLPKHLNESTDGVELLAREVEGGVELLSGAKELVFFPYDHSALRLSELAVPFDLSSGPYRVSWTMGDESVDRLEQLEGVWVLDGIAYSMKPQWMNRDVASATGSKVSMGTKIPSGIPWLVLGAAFLGGLLLNLMPCVLPVLSIKILHLVDQPKGQSPLSGSVVYTLGVLMSFWVLAGVLLGFRSAGEQLGWGFQLQNPMVVFALMLMFFVFALNLFGVFEVGLSLVGVDQKVQGKHGWGASFMSGVLATLSATPCSAPFMGSAMGATLTMSTGMAFLVFSFLGLGMAFPFLLLGFVPSWTRYIPKPGAWMVAFKQGLAFMLMGTVAFLYYVMSTVVADAEQLLWAGFALVAVAFAVWLWGNWAQPHQSKALWFRCLGWAIILWAVSWVWPKSHDQLDHIPWMPYKAELVDAAVSRGETVFVDFTASWCMSCKVNEKLVLDTSSMAEHFRTQGVKAFKADWSRRSDDITAALAKYGRNSVPLYLVFKAGKTQPEVLPQVLSEQIVLDAISK